VRAALVVVYWQICFSAHWQIHFTLILDGWTDRGGRHHQPRASQPTLGSPLWEINARSIPTNGYGGNQTRLSPIWLFGWRQFSTLKGQKGKKMCSRLNCFDYNLTAVDLKLICRRFNLYVSHLHVEPVILKLNFTESSQTVCQSRLSKDIGINCIGLQNGV
jgi:hypothetical protein